MCPPCKIIIDDPGALAASARLFARWAEKKARLRTELQDIGSDVAAAAHYLADIATVSGEALIYAIDSNVLDAAAIDEAHAFSELSCHRAAALRKVVDSNTSAGVTPLYQRLLMQWAEELREHTTKIVGGEYNGGWVVNGTNGIERKP